MRLTTGSCLLSLLLALPFPAVVPAQPGPRLPELGSVQIAADTVGRFEKLELRIGLEAEFANPFDPAEIDLRAEFTAPSGRRWEIPGFYNPTGWEILWMVRFSPDETGAWRYRVRAVTPAGTAEGGEGAFTVRDSPHRGVIGIAPNGRYLRYQEGGSFYGVGMWYNDGCGESGGADGQITEPDLDGLVDHGVNFISFFPTPLETMGSGLGRYDQSRCLRLDQVFQWCEQRELKISWNINFHSYLSDSVWGGGNARYRHTPYRLICDAQDYFTDPQAWQFQERLYRYIIARWGYSRSLFLWFVIDEIDGTEGWVKGDTLAAEAWSRKVHDYFKANDPYGRLTTGTKCGAFPQFWPGGGRIFDIAAREIYEAQQWPMPKRGKLVPEEEHPLRVSYRNYHGEARRLWESFPKPGIIGETGWDHTYYEPGMPGYAATYHNALWAGMSSGLCATPFWWAYNRRINDGVLGGSLAWFSRFVREIDFAGMQEPRPARLTTGQGTDGYAIRDGAAVFGWVANSRAGVAGESFTIEELPDGEYELRLYLTWRGRYLEPQTITARGGRLTVIVPELHPEGGHGQNTGHDIAFRISPRR